MLERPKTSKKYLLAGTSALAISLLAAPPLAAQQQANNEDEESIDEIIVTGSRIRRSDFESPAPVVSLGVDEIEAAGTTELSEVLLQIPGVATAVNGATAQGGAQRAGLDTVDLRNLGANRTLILIDGRRAVSNRGNTTSVSLSTIPNGFVERIEVLTGGSSAVYGSDAIAGVVNIITESDFEGLRFDTRGQINSRGDNPEYRLRFRSGTKFDDDRGYIHLSAEWDDRKGIFARERDAFLVEADFDYQNGINEFETITGADRPASELTRADFSDRSDEIPGGNFEDNDFFFDENGLQADFVRGINGFDFRSDDAVLIPRERLSVATKLTYEFSDKIEGFAQAIYSRLETRSVREPRGLNDGDTGDFLGVNPDAGDPVSIQIGRIPLDNAFAQAFPEIIDAASSSGIDFERRFSEVGLRLNNNNRTTFRGYAGFRGEFENGWQWEVNYGYGRFLQNQVRANEIDLVALRQGLQTDVVDGEIVCADPAARAAGCVPVNLFGVGSITPEAANFIRADLALHVEIEQNTAQAFTSGDLFDTAAGPVGFAIGGEYRSDTQDLTGDPLSTRGGLSTIPIPAFNGNISVYEAFTEISVPLIVDKPFFESLVFDGSFRVADYNIDNVGTVFSYTAGLVWAPYSDLTVRARYSRSQRAPDIAELFSPPRGDSDGVTDICNGVTETSSGTEETDSTVVANNCRATAGIAQFFADNPGATFEQEDDTISGPNSGNGDLFEETADTYTVGVVYSPGFAPGFSVSVDYYDITVNDAIDSLNGEQILEQCFVSDDFGPSNAFCNDIVRAADGQLIQVTNRQINLNSVTTNGIDIQAQYRFNLEDYNIPGDFNFRFNYNHVYNLNTAFVGPTGIETVVREADVLDVGSFDDRFRATLRYELGNFAIRWRTSYFGNTIDDFDRLQDFREDLAADPTIETPMFLFFGDVFYHDIYAEYEFEVSETEMRVFAGINDIFDRGSPFIPSPGDALSGTASNFDSNFRFQGTQFYAGLRVDF